MHKKSFIAIVTDKQCSDLKIGGWVICGVPDEISARDTMYFISHTCRVLIRTRLLDVPITKSNSSECFGQSVAEVEVVESIKLSSPIEDYIPNWNWDNIPAPGVELPANIESKIVTITKI